MDFQTPKIVEEEAAVPFSTRRYEAFSPSVGRAAYVIVRWTNAMRETMGEQEFEEWADSKVADKLRRIWLTRPAIN